MCLIHNILKAKLLRVPQAREDFLVSKMEIVLKKVKQ